MFSFYYKKYYIINIIDKLLGKGSLIKDEKSDNKRVAKFIKLSS